MPTSILDRLAKLTQTHAQERRAGKSPGAGGLSWRDSAKGGGGKRFVDQSVPPRSKGSGIVVASRRPPRHIETHDAGPGKYAAKDFDGLSDLHALVKATSEGAPSRSQVLPHFHGIATSNMCIDRNLPRRNEFFYTPKGGGKRVSNGVWLSHVLRRIHAAGCPHDRTACAGVEPCGYLERAGLMVASARFSERQREDAAKGSGEGVFRLPDAQLREALLNASSVDSAHLQYVAHRRLLPLRGSVVAWGELQGNVDPNRWYCPQRFDQPGVHHWSCADGRPPLMGAFEPAAAEWTENVPAAPPFKYCRPWFTGRAEPPVLRIPDVALLLPEQHGQINVGHQAKDLVFAAHVLALQHSLVGTSQAFRVSTLLVEDRSSPTDSMPPQAGFQYRNASLHALVAGADPPIHVAYLNQNAHWPEETQRLPNGTFGNEPQWRKARSICFDVVLQKGLIYAGDWRGVDLYRERVYAMCGIDSQGVADTLLVVSHGVANDHRDTRRWYTDSAGKSAEAYLLESLQSRRFMHAWCSARGASTPPCKPLQLVTRDMKGLSFCEQAALYARARVVVVHHGASLANGLFLRPTSVMVELSDQFDRNRVGEAKMRWAHVFDNAGYAALYVSAGLPYIGARVTYGVWPERPKRSNNGRPNAHGVVEWNPRINPKYAFTDPKMEIAINASRWAQVLELLDGMVMGTANRLA